MKSDKQSRAFLKKLGRRIRFLRKEQAISQAQLAYEANLRREAVGLIERGEQNPTVETLYFISKALNTEPGKLFDFKEDGFPMKSQ